MFVISKIFNITISLLQSNIQLDRRTGNSNNVCNNSSVRKILPPRDLITSPQRAIHHSSKSKIKINNSCGSIATEFAQYK